MKKLGWFQNSKKKKEENIKLVIPNKSVKGNTAQLLSKYQ